MFRVSYMFNHAWTSLQSWSAAGAMVASRVQLHWCHSPPGVVCEVWAWEVQAPRPLRGQHQLAAAAHRWADRQLDILTSSCRCKLAGWPATFAWDAVQMWIVCGAATLAAAFSACLGRSSGHQTLSHATHCRIFQTIIHSLSWLAVLFVDLEVFFNLGYVKKIVL